MERGSHNWFIRRGATESGPFPAGLVSRYILLGRVREDDEVSVDRTAWVPVFEVPELVPAALQEALAAPGDEQARLRLEAARRWADERWGTQVPPTGLEERRSGDGPARRGRAGRGRRNLEEGLRPIHYAGFALVLAVLVGVPFLLPSGKTSQGADCAAPAGPGVNWSGCLLSVSDLANTDLSGANLKGTDLSGSTLRAANFGGGMLSYANLAGANLRGADLRGAQLMGANLRQVDLTRADLRGANLSYAVLSGARLDGARLEGAQFDYAEWRDGIVCMPGSVGACRPARKLGG
jgi:hypothetical protein